VQGGCDYQVSSLVFGVEGQFDWADMNGTALLLQPAATNGIQLSSKLDRFGSATGRIGYAFDRVLLYAKGGAAWAHYNQQWAITDLSTTVAGGQNVTGFVVGGGFEFALMHNWSFKAEYNYFDFGTNGVPLNCAGAACGGVSAITFDIHQNVQTFMIGVNYRFGGFGPLLAQY
jgi:outer membrane immunogenic protein